MTGNPIVFQHREISLDTRLLVLGQEYHVNSAMLKDHSAFFFTFLDSPDKREHVEKKRQLNKETGRGFIYEWVSIIDSDGNGWSLVAEEGVTADPTTSLNLSDFKGDKKFEIDTFDKLLRAMHQEPYTLKSHDQFLAMIKLADYYCALPALSKSLDGPLARGEIRVTVLNREAMLVHGHPFVSNGVSNLPAKGSKSIPAYLRYMMQKIEDCCDPFCIQCYGNHLRRFLRYQLLCNNLKFMRNELVQGDLYDNFFLCAEIDDKDLPWDVTQKDW